MFFLQDCNANDCSSTGSSPGGAASKASSHIPKEDCDRQSKTGISSSDEDRLSFKLRGTGWGNRRAIIGLSGGGELTNGSTGWGPPPASGAGANSGWGAPPPPNPSVAAAWGNPVHPATSSSGWSISFKHVMYIPKNGYAVLIWNCHPSLLPILSCILQTRLHRWLVKHWDSKNNCHNIVKL